MQKKLIALAVAGLASTAAFAQSNVTVYGVADVYFGNFTTSGSRVTAVNSGGLAGSRLGFKGVEDLGNGLKALFTLEYGLAVDGNTGVGTGTATARQQFVGLTGNFGTAVAGRLQSPGYAASAKFDAHAGSVLSPLGQLTDAVGDSISARDDLGRFSNAVAYVSPNFSGFTATAAYSFVGENGTAPRQTGWTLAGDYDNGPIAANYTHVSLDNVTTTNWREDAIFGSYDFGVAKLNASWQHKKTDTAGVTVAKHDIYNVGVTVPVSAAGAVRASYAHYNDKLSANDASAYGIAYTHALSKRTLVYTGYTYLDNKGALAANLGVTNLTVGAGNNVGAFGLGINHSF